MGYKKQSAGRRQARYDVMPRRGVFEQDVGPAKRGGVGINRLVRGTGKSHQGLLAEHQALVVEIDHQQIAHRQQRDQTKRNASQAGGPQPDSDDQHRAVDGNAKVA